MWLGLVAYALALAGTLLLFSPGSRALAVILLVAAAISSVEAWGARTGAAAFPAEAALSITRVTRVTGAIRARISLRLLGMGLAALLAWRAGVAYVSAPQEPFGAAGWLWLASMALLLFCAAGWPGAPRNLPARVPAGLRPDPDMPAQDEGSLALNTPGSKSEPAPAPGWTLGEVALVVGIATLALLLRVWDLGDFPFAIHGDEIVTGRVAVQSFRAGQQVSIFSTVWSDIDLPALWFVFVNWSLQVGGHTLEALRLPAALFGAATVLPLYGLVRAAWGRWAAVGSTAILAFSVSNVHLSRITINNIVTQFFWATCFFFLLRGLRSRRPLDWVLAGFAAGLSEYFYYGTRLLFLVLLGFAAYLLVVHWRQARSYLGHMALLALAYLVAFGPLLAHFMTHPGLYFGRGQGVLTWNHIPTSWDDFVKMVDTLWGIMAQNLLAISTTAGHDSVYFASLLLPAEAALLVLGARLLLWNWRQPDAFLMLLSGLGVLFVGGTLVPDYAFIVHWTPAFPAFFAAVGVPIGAWADAVSERAARAPGGRGRALSRVLVPGTIVGGLALLGWLNVSFYFGTYHAGPEFEVRAFESRFAAALGATYRVRTVGRTWLGFDPEMASYLVKGQEGGLLLNPAAGMPLAGMPGRGLLFFFFPDNEQYLEPVRALYPGGHEVEVSSHTGNPPGISGSNKPTHLFYAYTLTPEQVKAASGVRLQMFGGDGQLVGTWPVERVGALPTNLDYHYPLRAVWSGAVYVTSGGGGAQTYRVELEGAAAGTVTIDGQTLAPAGSLLLQPGWHRLVAEAAIERPAAPRLMWSAGGGVSSEVPASLLWPVSPTQGLLGAVAGDGVPTVVRVDPFIGFTDAAAPPNSGDAGELDNPGLAAGASLPVRARWSGQVEATQAGQYTFELRSDGQARLSVDGNDVAGVCSGGDVISGQGAISLGAGWHELQLDYIGQPQQTTVELYWTTPNGHRELVPPGALRFAPGSTYRDVPAPVPPEGVSCASPAALR